MALCKDFWEIGRQICNIGYPFGGYIHTRKACIMFICESDNNITHTHTKLGYRPREIKPCIQRLVIVKLVHRAKSRNLRPSSHSHRHIHCFCLGLEETCAKSDSVTSYIQDQLKLKILVWVTQFPSQVIFFFPPSLISGQGKWSFSTLWNPVVTLIHPS